MKKMIMMLACCLAFCSCGERRDYVVDLSRETEMVSAAEEKGTFVIINKNSGTFHLDANCSHLAKMREENRMELYLERLDALFSHGYTPCGGCAKGKDHK